MKLILNAPDFTENYIKPVLDLDKKGKTSLFVEDGDLYSINEDVGVALYSRYTPESIQEPIERFNLNLNTLNKALACIPKSTLEFEVNANAKVLTYNDSLIRIKLTLLDSKVMIPPHMPYKTHIMATPYPTQFTVTKLAFDDIQRAMNFTETERFYIEMEDGKAFIYLGNKSDKRGTHQHDNTARIFLTDQITGISTESSYSIKVLKLLCQRKDEVRFKIAQNGTLVCEVQGGCYVHRYLVSSIK